MDLYLFQLLYSAAHQFWFTDQLIIFFADYSGYVLLVIALWFLWKEKTAAKRIYFASFFALSVILSRGIITEIIRFFYDKPRPFVAFQDVTPLINHSVSGALPSGHAAVFFALSLVMWHLNKKIGILFLIVAVLMGITRVIAGVHWPLDILFGAAVGWISVVVIKKILPRP